jgi:predicted hydrocarbon binding protein
MPSVLGMIEQFGGDVEAVAGEDVRREVLAGAERLKASSSPEKVSLWMRDAVDRLDELAGDDARVVMERCGLACSKVNHGVTDRAVARRARFATEEAFLAAEAAKPANGTRIELDGDVLYQVYAPREFSHPMRCFCGLMRGLPADAAVSPTYCQCSRAFVRNYWSQVLGRPVAVEILSSSVTGSAECRFRIELRPS